MTVDDRPAQDVAPIARRLSQTQVDCLHWLASDEMYGMPGGRRTRDALAKRGLAYYDAHNTGLWAVTALGHAVLTTLAEQEGSGRQSVSFAQYSVLCRPFAPEAASPAEIRELVRRGLLSTCQGDYFVTGPGRATRDALAPVFMQQANGEEAGRGT